MQVLPSLTGGQRVALTRSFRMRQGVIPIPASQNRRPERPGAEDDQLINKKGPCPNLPFCPLPRPSSPSLTDVLPLNSLNPRSSLSYKVFYVCGNKMQARPKLCPKTSQVFQNKTRRCWNVSYEGHLDRTDSRPALWPPGQHQSPGFSRSLGSAGVAGGHDDGRGTKPLPTRRLSSGEDGHETAGGRVAGHPPCLCHSQPPTGSQHVPCDALRLFQKFSMSSGFLNISTKTVKDSTPKKDNF